VQPRVLVPLKGFSLNPGAGRAHFFFIFIFFPIRIKTRNAGERKTKQGYSIFPYLSAGNPSRSDDYLKSNKKIF
jgi:hypothetical protein